MANEPVVKIDLNKIIMFWQEIELKYEKIKFNPEKREKDVSLGLTSLGMSIGGAIMAIAFAYFAFKCFIGAGDTASSATEIIRGIFGIFVGIFCAVVAVVSFVYLNLASIIYANYQRKLNQKKIGIIAFIVSLLLCVGTIVTVIVFAVQFLALR